VRKNSDVQIEATQEQGKVVLIKDQYGFIRFVDRSKPDLFFHQSDAPKEIRVGSEVEFSRVLVRGRLAAIDVCILPPGTVQFEEEVEGRFFGLVEIGLRPVGRAGSADSRGGSGNVRSFEGCIRLLESAGGEPVDSESSVDLLPFTAEDVRPPADLSNSPARVPRLIKGDEVEMTLVLDKGTGKKRAKDICLHRTSRQRKEDDVVKSMEESGKGKQRGVIERMREDFGFIRGLTGERDIFFRMQDVEAISLEGFQAEEGAEVEYFIIPDTSRARDSTKAVKITILPPGTLKSETIVQDLEATVSQKPRGDNFPGHLLLEFTDATQLPSSLRDKLKVKHGSSEPCIYFIEVPFWQEGVKGLSRLFPQDKVLTDLILDRSKGWVGTNCQLREIAPNGREEGIVTNLCEAYGFIRCCSRVSDVYFSFRELMDPAVADTSALQEGTEVSFNVIELSTFSPHRGEMGHTQGGRGDQSRLRATRVEILPQGTVWFEKLLAEGIRGLVQRDPKGTGMGVIKCPAVLPGLASVLEDEEFPELARQLDEFIEDTSKQELWMEPSLTSRERKALHRMAAARCLGHESQDLRKDNKLQSECVALEQDETESKDELRVLRIWKLVTAEEKEAWGAAESVLLSTLDAGEASYLFSRDDLRNRNQPVSKGTEVTFDIVFDRRRKCRCARNVVSVSKGFSATGGGDHNAEEMGIIVHLQEDRHFGFIERADPVGGTNGSNRIFFHISGLENHTEQPAARGQEVAFTVQERKGQLMAVRVRRLPHGTVQLKEVEMLVGLVAVLPEEEQVHEEEEHDVELMEGKLVILGLAENEEGTVSSTPMKLAKQYQVLPFTADDVVASQNGEVPVLARGDRVVITLASSRTSQTRTVREVHKVQVPVTARQSKVASVDTQQGVALLEARTASGAPISFNLKDVVGYFGPIRVGEEMDFLPVTCESQSDPNGETFAVGVVRVKDLGGVQWRRRGGVNKQLKLALRKQGIQANIQSRQAKGPDGTKGFPIGWRTSLSQASTNDENLQSNLGDISYLENSVEQKLLLSNIQQEC